MFCLLLQLIHQTLNNDSGLNLTDNLCVAREEETKYFLQNQGFRQTKKYLRYLQPYLQPNRRKFVPGQICE